MVHAQDLSTRELRQDFEFETSWDYKKTASTNTQMSTFQHLFRGWGGGGWGLRQDDQEPVWF